MELRQIEYFLRVVSEGSFSRAAETLHMTQPPLSVSIARLEKELGVKLLTREPRGVHATAAGAHFAQQAELILQNIDELSRDIRTIHLGRTGRVSVAAVPTITWFLLPRLLSRFAEMMPEADVSVSDPPPARVIESVMAGGADLGIIATVNCKHLGDSYRSSLNVFNAGNMRMLVALPPKYADAPERLRLADLHGVPWVVPRRSLRIRGLPELFDALWDELDLTPPEIRRVTTLQTAIPMVAAGLGVALVPDSVRTMGPADIVLRELADPVPPLQAGVIWSRDRALSQPAKAMLDLLRDGVLTGSDSR